MSKINYSVDNSNSSKNLGDQSDTASITSTGNSVDKDQSNEGDNVFHIIEMSSEMRIET